MYVIIIDMIEFKLTDDEILLLKDVAKWWKMVRIYDYENLVEKEKDDDKRKMWLKAIDILKDMNVGKKEE